MIVKCSAIVITYTISFFISISNARIHFVDGSQYYNNRPEIYYTIGKNAEQASKDVDVTFSAGGPTEYDNKVIYSHKKDYFPVSVSDIGAIRENDGLIYLFKEPMIVTTSRDEFRNDDLSIVSDRKTNKNFVNFNNGHKIEIILQLRVDADDNQ